LKLKVTQKNCFPQSIRKCESPCFWFVSCKSVLWIRGHKTRQNWYHRLTKRMYGWYGRASFKAKIRKTQRSISSPNQWLRIDNVKEAFSFNVTNLSCWCNYCVNLSSLFRNVTIRHSKFWKERNVLCSSSNMKVVVLWLKRNWNFIVIFMQARTFTKNHSTLSKKRDFDLGQNVYLHCLLIFQVILLNFIHFWPKSINLELIRDRFVKIVSLVLITFEN
jgi:hypothetical protein